MASLIHFFLPSVKKGNSHRKKEESIKNGVKSKYRKRNWILPVTNLPSHVYSLVVIFKEGGKKRQVLVLWLSLLRSTTCYKYNCIWYCFSCIWATASNTILRERERVLLLLYYDCYHFHLSIRSVYSTKNGKDEKPSEKLYRKKCVHTREEETRCLRQ